MLRIRINPGGLSLQTVDAVRLLDLVDDAEPIGFPLACRGARCGVCRVRVLSGAEHLVAAAQDERETLARTLASPDERLACQLWSRDKSSGELVLELSPAGAPVGS